MAHFAKVENNKVVDLIVLANEDCGGGNFPESETIGRKFISKLAKNDARLNGTWYQTSYNTDNGLYYSEGQKELYFDEDENFIGTNGDPNKGFRFNFGQIGYTFDPDAGEYGEFYPPENNEQ
jgi:hypothetical protein